MRLASRIVLFAALATSAPLAIGCSLIGAGIGSAVPRYETVDARRRVELGEDLRVVLLRPHRADDLMPRDGGGHVDGRYAGIHDGVLSLTVDGQAEPREIPLTDVAELRVRQGSYWTTGLVIGGAVDATFIVVALVAASQWENSMHFEVGSFK